LRIACLEEIAFHKGWLSVEQLTSGASALGKSSYAEYLFEIIERNAP